MIAVVAHLSTFRELPLAARATRHPLRTSGQPFDQPDWDLLPNSLSVLPLTVELVISWKLPILATFL